MMGILAPEAMLKAAQMINKAYAEINTRAVASAFELSDSLVFLYHDHTRICYWLIIGWFLMLRKSYRIVVPLFCAALMSGIVVCCSAC